MSKQREFWLNGNNWRSIDIKPFNCDDLIHLREVSPEYDSMMLELVEALRDISGGSWGPVDTDCTKEIENLLSKYEAWKNR